MNALDKHIRFFVRIALYGLLVLLLADCAKSSSPTGGPRDKEPPKVVKTLPEAQSLYFADNVVKFWFDEAIKIGSYGKEIFISPLPQKKPKIRLSDSAKKMTITFEEELRPQTTYVITLTEIPDFNASNKMKEAFTLAFSTGDQLDSLRLRGKVLSPTLGKVPEEMTVMLFDADSVINNNLFRQSPAYITKPNEQGEFLFEYLRNTEYRVFAINDKDQTNTYSQPSEAIAIGQDSVIRFPADSTEVAGIELYAFVADELGPLPQGYVWLANQTILVNFSENLVLDDLRSYASDTLGQNSAELTAFTLFSDPDPGLLLHMPRPRELLSQISLLELRDSLGNRSDTLLRVAPRRSRKLSEPLLSKPKWQAEEMQWEMISYRLWQESDNSLLFLTDTSSVDSLQKRYALTVEADAFQLTAKPQSVLTPGSYFLNVSGRYFLPEDSMDTDTVFTYPVNWPDPAALGTLSGVVKLDSPFVGPIIMELWSDKEKLRSVRDTVFAFTMLEPTSYYSRIIMDRDSNGIWTTGALWPIRLPEIIFEDRTDVKVRANWDFEGHVITVSTQPAPVAEADSVSVE
jgi:hypothetical protein